MHVSVQSQQTFLVFQGVFKTTWRRLQRNTFHLPRSLQDVFAIRLRKTSSRRLQDVFARRLAIMSSRRLQDVLEDKKMLHWRRLQDVFKTSSVRLHQDQCLLGYDWVLKFHISNKSNEQVMLGVTSGSELFWNRINRAARKGNAIAMQCEFRFNYLSMKIAWKFQLKRQLSI